MTTCHECQRQLKDGEYAWADSWWAIDRDGARHETRYMCDDCDARIHPVQTKHQS